MRTGLILLLSTVITMESSFQKKPTDRQPVAAGRFYSAGREALEGDLSRLFEECRKYPDKMNVRAIVSPHAGYVFSGKVAASAFSAIDRDRVYKNVFVIGSSHVMSFDGASVYNTGDYITPLGRVVVNKEIANKLIRENRVFDFPTTAHLQEHSIEVQLPFIQYYFTGQPAIVPVIVGTNNESTIKKIAEALKPWFTPDNLFIISSDFSHYPAYKEAIEADNATAQGFTTGDPQTFLKSLKNNSSKHIDGLATSMCGWTSGLTLLYLSQNSKTLEYKMLDYCNSGDSEYGDKDRVVGYHAMALIEKDTKAPAGKVQLSSFSFTDKDRNDLFGIARKSISSRFYESISSLFCI